MNDIPLIIKQVGILFTLKKEAVRGVGHSTDHITSEGLEWLFSDGKFIIF